MPTSRKRRGYSYPLTPRRVRAEEIEMVAQRVARVILSHAEGSLLLVDTWTTAARTLGAQVKAFRSRSGAPGFYQGGQQPTIYYNMEATWPETTFPRASHECYDDDRQSVQHRIARRVEDVLLGDDSF